jgi:hypothetical protein
VIDGDVRALFREYLGNPFADPLAGSGNERYFIAELLYCVGASCSAIMFSASAALWNHRTASFSEESRT